MSNIENNKNYSANKSIRCAYSRIKRYLKNPINAILLMFVVALSIIVLSGDSSLTFKKTNASQTELKVVKSAVNKLIILPKDDEPTLAVVDNASELKSKFLQDHAQNGDKILIYTKSGMIIIYRASINKIAAVGSLSADPAYAEAKGATVTVLNGSGNSEKTNKVLQKVKNAYSELKVVDGGNTNKKDFTTTIVIDNTNQKDNLVDALTNAIPAKRGVVPLGEVATNSDLMIIVGKD